MGTGTLAREMQCLAAECNNLEYRDRPEVAWLKERYGDFMRKEGFTNKAEADGCLYERMYDERPVRQRDILKIRYWRTGQHLPVSHGECCAFGRALELNRKDMLYLLQGYYDSCDLIHEKEPDDIQSVYWTRRNTMKYLTDRYLSRIPQDKLAQMRITDDTLEHSIRHLYYTDALAYVHLELKEAKKYMRRHITSVTYDSEFCRNMKLLGVIPRKTMIRHLLILGMPDVSLGWMSRQLGKLGYLELQEQHTLRGGERLDWLMIQLLRRYEAYSRGRAASECCQWMQENCRMLDLYFEQKEKKNLRFMYFKALKA